MSPNKESFTSYAATSALANSSSVNANDIIENMKTGTSNGNGSFLSKRNNGKFPKTSTASICSS